MNSVLPRVTSHCLLQQSAGGDGHFRMMALCSLTSGEAGPTGLYVASDVARWFNPARPGGWLSHECCPSLDDPAQGFPLLPKWKPKCPKGSEMLDSGDGREWPSRPKIAVRRGLKKPAEPRQRETYPHVKSIRAIAPSVSVRRRHFREDWDGWIDVVPCATAFAVDKH